MKAWLKVIGFLFVLPLFAVIFFQYAPDLENKTVHEQFAKAISQNPEIPDETKATQLKFLESLNFAELCLGHSEDGRALVQELRIQDVCESFERFSWVQVFSFILLGLGILHLMTTWVLGQMAMKSRSALIRFFRLGWRTSTVFSLSILLGQTIVAVYTLYYFTVLFTGSYFPKLLLMIAVGGVWAFFKIAQMIISRIPIQSYENSAESVSESQAPNLWHAVREVAQKIGTAPPDHILMGLSTSFYVTEFPVHHGTGVTSGRTLYLSEPMMRQMPLDEITAIIGHEMGHFHGEDTALTRELTPMLVKSNRTMMHLSEAGWVGVPAMHAMGVFTYFFEKSTQAFHRERELIADAAGAAITSARSAALALARYSYASAIHTAALNLQIVNQIPKDQALGEVLSAIQTDENFWKSLTALRVPHPFDSHPPLAIRMEKLGFTMTELQDLAMEPVGSSAYDQLVGEVGILDKAYQEQEELVQNAQHRVQLQTATTDSAKMKEILEVHFPTVVLKYQSKTLLLGVILYLFLIALFAVVFLFVVPGVGFQIFGIIGTLIGFYLLRDYWLDWKEQSLTLTSESIQLKSWKEPLFFQDIKEMKVLVQHGTRSLRVELHAKRPPVAKRPILRWARRAFTIDLTGFPPKSETVARQIFRYYLREIE